MLEGASGEDCMMRSCMVCTSHQMIGWYNPDEWDGWGIWCFGVYGGEQSCMV